MGREAVGAGGPAQQCLSAGQRVCTANGAVKVEELTRDGGFQAVCYEHGARRFVLRKAVAAAAGRKPVLRLHTDKGPFDLTADQLVILESGASLPVAELTPGTRLCACTLKPQTDYRVISGDSDNKFAVDHLTAADCAVVNWYPAPSVETLGEAEVYKIELTEGGQSHALVWSAGPGGGFGIAIAG